MFAPNQGIGLTQVFEQAPNVVGALFAFGLTNLVALSLVQARSTAGRWISLAGLGALCWGICSEFTLTVGLAVGDYWGGRPTVRVSKPGNPSAETRIEELRQYHHRSDQWRSDVLSLHIQFFGPRGYVGPYPSAEEAVELLADHGTAPRLLGGSLLAVGDGPLLPVRWTDDDKIRALLDATGKTAPNYVSGIGISAYDLRAGLVERSYRLADNAVLIQTPLSNEIRVWDSRGDGRGWARYPRVDISISE